jgi:4-amino-4-deoxy-L-arabinose transferase-like glycosyltransferase
MPTATNCRVRNFLARHSFALGLAVVWSALTIAAMVSWRKWPDLIVDFGLQLYIPWRLADGAVLYRDLFYMAGGPLSQYFHAALFKIFGTSLTTLICSNLLITVGLASLIYLRFRRVTDTVTGTLLAVAVVIGFAFAAYSSGGNYNYLAPYSHEMLHGLTLGILTLVLLTHDSCKNNRTTLLGAGFATGLVALTKPDIFLALMLTLLFFFGLAWRANRQPVRSRLAASVIFIGAGLAPLIGFFLFFLSTESWQESLRLEFFGWRPLFIAGVVQNPFYQQCLGLDLPLLHVQQMARQFLVCGLVVGGYAALFKWLKTQPSVWRLLASGLAISPLLMAAANFNWVGCGAALPLLSVTAIIILAHEYFTDRNTPKDLFREYVDNANQGR